MAAAHDPTRWEHAVLRVILDFDSLPRSFTAVAWVGDREIYRETEPVGGQYVDQFTALYWTRPLADLGAEGWELVTTSIHKLSYPVHPRSADFFLKRAVAL